MIYMATVDSRHSLEYRLHDYLYISICWAMGLASTISVKIILAGFVMGINDGADKLLLRMGNEYSYGYRFMVVTYYAIFSFAIECFKDKILSKR